MRIAKLIKNMHTKSSPLTRGTAGALFANGTGLFLAFALQVLLTRVLPLDEYGACQYVLSWGEILLLISIFGLDTLLLRSVSAYSATREWRLLRGVLSSSMRWAAASSATLMIAGVVFILALRHSMSSSLFSAFLVFFLLVLPFWTAVQLELAIVRGFKKILLARAPETILRPILVGGFVWLFIFVIGADRTAPVVMMAYALTMGLSFTALWWGLKQILPADIWGASPVFEKQTWLASSKQLMLVASMFAVLNQIDAVMIGLLRGVREVGTYSVAVRIALLIIFGLQAVNTIAAPLIAEYHKTRTREEFQELIGRVALWISVLTIPVVLVIVIFADPILSVFGEEYRAAYWVLMFLGAGQLVNVLSGPCGFMLTMTGHERESLRILVAIIAINIMLNIPGIILFGAEGAALATGFAIALRNVWMWTEAKRLLQIDSSVFSLLSRRK